MSIIQYFKKLKRKRELKKFMKGMVLLAQYSTEMVRDGSMTAEKAANIMDAAIAGYVEEAGKPI